MNATNTQSDARRSLPEGHDDEQSPFYVPPQLRDAYRTILVTPTALDEALAKRRVQEDRDQAVAIWTRTRDQIERNHSPEYFARWLKRQRVSRPGELPPKHVLEAVLSEHTITYREGRDAHNVRQLTEAQVAETTHRATLETAEASLRNAEKQRRQRAALKAAQTCAICGTVTDTTTTREATRLLGRGAGGKTVRTCTACADVAPILALLTEETPAGSRLGALAAWLDGQDATGRLSEADIDAWLDDPTARDLPTTPRSEPRGPGLLSRVSRALGGGNTAAPR